MTTITFDMMDGDIAEQLEKQKKLLVELDKLNRKFAAEKKEKDDAKLNGQA